MQPTRENYAEYVAARNERTREVMAKGDSVTGAQVKARNLALKLFANAGWTMTPDGTLRPPKD